MAHLDVDMQEARPRPSKAPRHVRKIEEWATQQVLSENAQLRTTVTSLNNERMWADARHRHRRLTAVGGPGHRDDHLACVRMVQDHTGPIGGFPHQWISAAGIEGGTDLLRFVCTRKMVRISGFLQATCDPEGRLAVAHPPDHEGGEPTRSSAAPAAPVGSIVAGGATTPLNASAFGTAGLLYSLVLVDTCSGTQYTPANYPGREEGVPYVEWPNGDRSRGHFRIGPDESRWTIRFRFPHVPRDRKDRTEWCFRFTPEEESLRERYPALTFETARFRACARLKDE